MPINGRRPADPREVFYRHVTPGATHECWEWTGLRDRNGYGRYGVRSLPKLHLAHRAAWYLFREGMTANTEVCHHCDNPSCVNPNHLFLGTRGDNARDMVEKGRSNRGTKHPNHKLTDEHVAEIKGRLAAGGSQASLARQFGVAQSTVSRINSGDLWGHI